MKHILSVLVENQPGVLVRVAGMFSRRGFNIDSLAVGVTHKPEFSRMTVAVTGDQAVVDQVIKQLSKLVEVISIQVLDGKSSVTRGMAMIKVTAGEHRADILKLGEIFRANVIDISEPTVTMEITGDEEKIKAFTELLTPYGIEEVVCTGLIGLKRGASTIYNMQECEYHEQNVL